MGNEKDSDLGSDTETETKEEESQDKDQESFADTDLYYYEKIDLDKLYLGEKKVDPGIGKDVINIGNKDEKSFKNTWVQIGDEIHYIDANGNRLNGFYNFGKDSYYFTDKGLLRNDKMATNSGIYELDESGRASLISKPKPGWVYLVDRSFYYDTRGKLLKGFKEVNNNRYVFNPKTGQVEKDKISTIDNNKYYSATNGVARRIGWDYYNALCLCTT